MGELITFVGSTVWLGCGLILLYYIFEFPLVVIWDVVKKLRR